MKARKHWQLWRIVFCLFSAIYLQFYLQRLDKNIDFTIGDAEKCIGVRAAKAAGATSPHLPECINHEASCVSHFYPPIDCG